MQAPPADPQQETEETSTQSVPSTETEQQSQNVTPAEPAVAPQINEPAPAIQPDFDTRMKDMEQQLKGYEAEKAQQVFTQQKQQVQAQYEQQGYDTEVATVLTQQWEANAMQMHQMQNAALHRENLMAGMMT